jgi:outer membrane lipoprotein-sorting protein
MEQAQRVTSYQACLRGNVQEESRQTNPFIPPQSITRNETMRRDLIPAFLFVLAMTAGAFAPAGAAPPTQQAPIRAVPHFTDADRADLQRISAYLNTLQSVQGRFVQVGADGKAQQGTFYLRKPGRVRFEYEKPNPNLVVADGTTVAVQNTALHTTDRYPIGNSPLRLLLSDKIDLTHDDHVAALKHEPGALSLTAREASGPATGTITLTFADSGGSLELRQWNVVDAQGGRTNVVLNEMRQVAEIPAALFVIQDLSPFKKNGR